MGERWPDSGLGVTAVASPWQQTGVGPFAHQEGKMFAKLITTAAVVMVVAVGTANAGSTP